MTINDILTWIGTVISVLSAVFSIFQAIKAKKAKTQAENIKNYLIEKYSNYEEAQIKSEISQLLIRLNRITTQTFDFVLNDHKEVFENCLNLTHKIMGLELYEKDDIKSYIDLITSPIQI